MYFYTISSFASKAHSQSSCERDLSGTEHFVRYAMGIVIATAMDYSNTNFRNFCIE